MRNKSLFFCNGNDDINDLVFKKGNTIFHRKWLIQFYLFLWAQNRQKPPSARLRNDLLWSQFGFSCGVFISKHFKLAVASIFCLVGVNGFIFVQANRQFFNSSSGSPQEGPLVFRDKGRKWWLWYVQLSLLCTGTVMTAAHFMLWRPGNSCLRCPSSWERPITAECSYKVTQREAENAGIMWCAMQLVIWLPKVLLTGTCRAW